MVLLRPLQEINFFLQFSLGFVRAGDLVKGDFGLVSAIASGFRAPDAKEPGLALTCIDAHPPKKSHQKQSRKPIRQQVKQPRAGGRSDIDNDLVLLKY